MPIRRKHKPLINKLLNPNYQMQAFKHSFKFTLSMVGSIRSINGDTL